MTFPWVVRPQGTANYGWRYRVVWPSWSVASSFVTHTHTTQTRGGAQKASEPNAPYVSAKGANPPAC